MGELISVDALGPRGSFRARHRMTVPDVTGAPVAELSLVPGLYVNRTISAMRKASTMPADERAAVMARAAVLFATGVVNGQTPDEYHHAVSRISGMAISVVRRAAFATAEGMRQAYRCAQLGRPAGAAQGWRDPTTHLGGAVWARRGDVFAVLASGNHPGVHALWLEAIALGYRVAVRPSRREPLTPYRLIASLREAGFGDDQVTFLPTEHEEANEILRGADLGMVYGGDEVVKKYADDPRVLPQGPGRSKILITKDVDWRDYLDMIVSSVSSEGGTACVNTTGVLVEGDPTPLATALAERLAMIPSLPPEDEKAVLPVTSLATARGIEKYLFTAGAGATALLGGNGIVDELGDGSATLRPSVYLVDRPDAAQLRVELPYPCVWVAPWAREAGIAPLRDTLVLAAATTNDELIDQLFDEPSIHNVYIGHYPTHWIEPGIPHDGYLSEFLMRTKAFVRD